jgi:hypothetical protein
MFSTASRRMSSGAASWDLRGGHNHVGVGGGLGDQVAAAVQGLFAQFLAA